MSITELLAKLRHLDIEIRLESEKLKLSAPKGALTAELRDEIVSHKEAIIAFLSEAVRDSGRDLPALRKIERSDALPLSYAQNRMWFLYQLAPNSAYYNLPLALMLKGEINIDILERLFLEIVRRHEILRTVYQERSGNIEQIVGQPPAELLNREDLSSSGEEEQDVLIRERIREEAGKAFDLTRDLMLRVKILELGEQKHVVILTMHHIASDGWSYGVFLREFTELYEAFSKGRESGLPELEYQYTDYAAWQRELLSEDRLEGLFSYWKAQLETVTDLELPADLPRNQDRSRAGGLHKFQIDKETFDDVRAYAKKKGMTSFMVTLGIYQLLLARYTGQSDFCVGTPIAGRRTTGLEQLIGFFVNSLPLRVSYDGTLSFDEYMKQVKETCLDAFAHQDMPFDLLVERLQIKRDLTKNPIYQTMFSFRAERRKSVSLPDLEIEQLDSNTGQAKFDLLLTVTESKGGLGCSFEYDTGLFDERTLISLANGYRALLKSAVISPDKHIANLPIVTDSVKNRVLYEWNDTKVDYPRSSSIHEIFSRVARERSNNTAIVLEGESLSYRELEERSNQLARFIKTKGVDIDQIVGVSLERSFDLIIATLAILKAGGAYLPLDPGYPLERIGFLLQDTNVKLILTSRDVVFPNCDDIETIRVDEICTQIRHLSDAATEQPSNPHQLAYVIFTSGSTGRPKGVAVSHQNVVRLVKHSNYSELSPETVVLQYAPFAFDASTFEIWGPLLNGGTVALCPPGQLSLEELGETIEKNRVTTLFLTTALFHSLVDQNFGAFRLIKQLFVGGEVLSPDRVEFARSNFPCEVFPIYGPTENTTFSSWHADLRPGSVFPLVPIGKPISNTRAYVLDSHLQPVPIGAIGELYLGGDGVARGYVNRPSLTAELFIPDPFAKQTGARMYRTGDLARWRPDGNLDFHGRTDNQVKIRGHRIEPGEVEARLQQHPDVTQCAVAVITDGYGDKSLVGYIVTDGEEGSLSGVQSFLKTSLPDYMVPSNIVMLEALPLTTNGKIDRKALPKPDLNAIMGAGEFVEPATEIEKRLAEIWQEILHLEKVSTQVDFFTIGGHSLLATQIVSRIRSELDVELPLMKIFEFSTIAGLAGEIERAEYVDSLPPIRVVSRDKPLELSYAQNRMWFLNQLAPNSSYYNMPSALVLKGTIDVDVLERAFRELVRRHEIIRTVYREREGRVEQIAQEVPSQILRQEDLSSVDGEEQGVLIRERIREESQRPFDLSADLMLRVKVLRIRPKKHIVIFNMHHIASDGWSFGVLIREIVELYRRHSRNESSTLPELDYQYADYAAWQREILSKERLENDLFYWKNQLESVADLELPVDRRRTNERKWTSGKYTFQIDKETLDSIRGFAQKSGVTPFMLMLGLYQLLLARYTGQTDFCVGTPIAGRRTTDLEQLIGFFVNSLPLRVRYEGTVSFSKYLKQVKETCLDAFAHQDMPFDLLVEKLQLERDLTRNPIFQTMFSYQAEQRESYSLPDLEIERLESGTGQAKFDLLLTVVESSNGLHCSLEYDANLFEEDTSRRLAEGYVNLLKSAVSSPEREIARLPLMAATTRETLLHRWNATAVEYPRDSLIHEIFARVAGEQAAETALLLDDENLSYRQLEERSNQLAHHLIARGVSDASLVGLSLERSFETVIGLLAILKAGCAYVPLEPDYPKQRLEFMLRDTRLQMILTQCHLTEHFPRKRDVQFICLDHDAAEIEKHSTAPIEGYGVSPDSLAYVMYTSGSTGQPKGVAVTHRNVVRTALSPNYCTLDTTQTLFQYAPLAFDASTFEIWGGLLNGARLVICPPGPKSLEEISFQVLHHGVTTLWLTGGLFHKMVDGNIECFSGLKQLLAGGDALSPGKVEKTLAAYPSLRVINGYGPTENTTFTACCSISSVSELTAQVPIGRPVSNTEIYILDGEFNPVPIGAIGELYSSGDGVARGYMNRSGLTAERFVPNPFDDNPGARMYRTGDLALWLPDGRIEFYGRRDTQVKIRGHRIELGEIESHLLEHPHIRQSTVSALDDGHRDKRLVGYIVTDGKELSAQDLQSFLEKSLPGYMIPSIFVELGTLPLTANGKIDRRALPDPDLDAIAATEGYIEPKTETEKRLAKIWRKLLQLEKVSAHAEFFSIGGHSLLAANAVSRIKDNFQIELKLKEFFENTTIEKLGRVIDSSVQITPIALIPRTDPREHYPCTSAQRRQYILSMMDEIGVSYNIPIVVRVKGALKKSRFLSVFSDLVARHDAMRTRFGMVDGEIVQIVDGPFEIDLEFTRVDEGSVEKAVKSFVRPFDLTRAPLWRAALYQVSSDEGVLIIDAHHIVLDGVSLENLVAEFCSAYGGKKPPLPPLQQKDFAVWQMEDYLLTEGQRDAQFWLKTLSGELTLLSLPVDRPRPAIQSFRGSTHRFLLDEKLSSALRDLATSTKSTLFFTLLGIYKILLHKFTGQEDLIVGIPVAGRPHHDLNRAVGMFVNTLALRSRPTPTATANEFLSAVKKNALEAFEHQLFPYEELLDKLQLKRDMSRNPLFDTLFSMFESQLSTITTEGLEFSAYPLEKTTAKFDLSLSVHNSAAQIGISIEYCQDLFVRETIERLGKSFVMLCEELCDDLSKPIQEIHCLAQEERRLVVEAWNQTKKDFQSETSLTELIDGYEQQIPEQIAVRLGDRSISFKELVEQSNRVAIALQDLGIGPESVVGVCLGRSIDAIIAMLGVMKCGGAYLPLDPQYPMERLKFMCEDADTMIVFAEPPSSAIFEGMNAQTIEVQTLLKSSDSAAKSLKKITTHPKKIAYVIYTSGSTGRPKGIAVTHANLLNLVQWYRERYNIGPETKMAQFVSPSFDVSVWEIWSHLASGATIDIIPEYVRIDMPELYNFMQDHEIDLCFLPTPIAHEFVQLDWSQAEFPRLLFTGGAKLERRPPRDAPFEFVDFYGPAEDTVVSTCESIRAEESETLKIGPPVPNVQAYVLDQGLNPVPIGVKGELYLAGGQLARGYVKRPRLTAERFVPNPFDERPGSRMYRTGDMARWTKGGKLEFVGREDDQVQLRGIRIELKEIEAILMSHPEVVQAAVVIRELREGDKLLVAYLSETPAMRDGEIDFASYLGEKLPRHMIPSTFVYLEKFPLGPTGKIDRKKLPEPDRSTLPSNSGFIPPQSDTEKVLARIWCDVLDVKSVSANDDFFQIGGHSLLAAKVVSIANQQLHTRFRLIELFENSTIQKLARLQDSRPLSFPATVIHRADKRPYYPCTSAQRRMYILNNLDKEGVSYNLPIVVRITGPLDRSRLEAAFEKLAETHEAMRTRFFMKNGELVQIFENADRVDIEFIECEEHDAEEHVSSFIRPFELSQAPLWRARVIRQNFGDHLLAIDAHHIVLDGVSLVNLIRDFHTLYGGGVVSEPTLRQIDFAVWQQEEYLPSVGLEDEKHWLEMFSDEIPILRLPTDHPRSAIKSFRGNTHSVLLGKQLARKIKRLARSLDSTVFFTLLAIYKILLHKFTGQEDVVVGIPVSGRPHHDLEATVGMFVNTLAIHSFPRSEMKTRVFLDQVKRDSLLSIEHQLYPLETLIDKLEMERDTSRNPLFDTMFSMLGAEFSVIETGDLTFSPYKTPSKVSKFDLSIVAHEYKDDVRITMEYCTDLFEKETIERIGNSFRTICESVCSDPSLSISEVEVLSHSDREHLLTNFGSNPCQYEREQLFIEFFEESVAKRKYAIAVIDGDEELTYTELHRRSSRLAALLVEKGAQAGDRVAVLLRRSVGAIVSFIAVLKARCVYVPIDPNVPPQRIVAILSDSAADMVISETSSLAEEWRTGYCLSEKTQVLNLEEVSFSTKDGDCVLDTAFRPSLPEDDAYIIFTSGSTGTPKGTRISHGSLAHYVQAYCELSGFDENDRIVQVKSLSFDASVEEIAPPLYAGGSISVFPQNEVFDVEALRANIVGNRVTVAPLSPLLAAQIAKGDPCHSLRILTSGGDSLTWEHVKDLHTGLTVWNLYGPTETTIACCAHRITLNEESEIPIGRPLPNYELYVLDKHHQLRPIGVPGELYIAGPGLSSGYLGREDLTREKFVPNPFKPGEKMYATGDLAKWRADGELLFLGRIDRQVQIRGFRVELGEIEAVIGQVPGIENTVVVAREKSSGMKQLVCYYSAIVAVAENVLREAVSEILPQYMVPNQYICVERWPLLPSGKVDSRKLPDVSDQMVDQGNTVEPRNRKEEEMYAIWQHVLGGEDLDIHANFFDHGGNSFSLIQLKDAIAEKFERSLPLVELFNHPTIAGMSMLLETRESGSSGEGSESEERREILASAEVSALLKQDAVLDRSFIVKDVVSSASVPENILLTGATGFLGRELACQMLKKSQATIHCLVRCRNREEGMTRLKHVLGDVVDSSELEERIEIIPGDLGQAGLGLRADQLMQLSRTIDSVLHNGAAVNAVFPYSMLRESNVLGTRECLRIAMTGKAKPFHYISTASVLHAHNENNCEADQASPAEYALPAGGYAQSKWIGEVLVQQGADRGLPVNIYRPGRIVGHSETGISNQDDLLVKAVRACLLLGVAPEVSVPVELSPVDAVSRSILTRVFDGEGESAVLDMAPRTVTSWTTVVGWLQQQVPSLELVPVDRWLAVLESGYDANSSGDLQAVRGIFGQHNQSGRDPGGGRADSPLAAAGIVASPLKYRSLELGGPEVDALAVSKWLRHWTSFPGDHN